MVTTLKEIRQEIAKLEKQAKEIEKKEKQEAIDEIKRLIQEYDITANDLGFELKYKRKSRSGKAAQVRYQKGDRTWSGRGRKPKWVREIIEQEGEAALEKYKVE